MPIDGPHWRDLEKETDALRAEKPAEPKDPRVPGQQGVGNDGVPVEEPAFNFIPPVGTIFPEGEES